MRRLAEHPPELAAEVRPRKPCRTREVVDYRDVQFTKTPEILRGMGLAELPKTKQALAELREKGLS